MVELHGRLERWPSLTLDERCALIRDLAIVLFEPVADDGYRDDELAGAFAPPALRALFSTAGRTLQRANDPLAPPRPHDGQTHRLFTENQGCFAVVACPEEGEDDPWVAWNVEGKALPMTSRLSDVIVAYAVLQAGHSGIPVAMGNLVLDGPRGALAAIETRTSTLRCGSWPWPMPTRIVHGSGLFGSVMGDAKPTDRWVLLFARDVGAFEFLRPFGRDRWDVWPFDEG